MKKITYTILLTLLSTFVIAQCVTDEYNYRLVKDKLSDGQTLVDYLEQTYSENGVKYD